MLPIFAAFFVIPKNFPIIAHISALVTMHNGIYILNSFSHSKSMVEVRGHSERQLPVASFI